MTTDGRLAISRLIGPIRLAGGGAGCWLSRPRVIGTIRAIGGNLDAIPEAIGRLSVARVLGPIMLAGAVPGTVCRLSASRVVGSVRSLGATSDDATVSVARFIGYVRMRGTNGADPWTAAGFPAPRTTGYLINPGHALVRTAMESGATRQRTRWLRGFHQCTATFTLGLSQLASLEVFLETVDYDWFGMPITLVDACELRQVRVIDNPTFQSAGPALIDVQLKLEVRP